jgi:hypothetical protein
MDNAILYCEVCDHIYLDVEFNDDIGCCVKCAEVM